MKNIPNGENELYLDLIIYEEIVLKSLTFDRNIKFETSSFLVINKKIRGVF